MQSQQNRMLYVTPDSPEEALDGSFRRMAQELATADSLKVSLLREALAKDLPIDIFYDESSALKIESTGPCMGWLARSYSGETCAAPADRNT